jgi:hypothetical protein
MAIMWRKPLQPVQSAAGTAVTAASVTSGLGGLPIAQLSPADLIAGGHLSLKATGELTSTSATPTVILDFRIGTVGQAIGSKVVIAASAALVINASATAWPFIMYYEGTVRALSPSAGVIHGQGYVKTGFTSASGLTAAFIDNPMPITAALRTVSTLNTDQTNELDVGITLSSVTGTPSVTITDFWADLAG